MRQAATMLQTGSIPERLQFDINNNERLKTILTIITVSKDGHRRNMNTSFMTSNLDSYRKEILESNPGIQKVFFIYEEKVE